MVRIVHTGDMHFDSPFAALPWGVAQLRKEEQRETFLRIIEAVREYKADILLIAGDMFDSRFVSMETIKFLKEAFSAIPDTAIFIAPGNHDFLSQDSPYYTENFGENVHIFSSEPEGVPVGDAVVYGFGFQSRFITKSALSAGMSRGEKNAILLMHGDVAAESAYNPISLADLAESGFAYAALGHVHSYSGICHAGETAYAYCGIPEGRHFDEGEKGGFIRGEISDGDARLEFVPIAKRQNTTLEVDVTDLSGMEAVKQRILGMLSAENLYKIVLGGKISNTMYIDKALLQKELSNACMYCKIIDKTTLLEEAAEDSLLAKLFAERLAGRTDEIGNKALRYGLDALRRQRK